MMMMTARAQATQTAESIEQGKGTWQCEYTPQDAQFWAPDHLAIRSLAVAEDLETLRSSALLDIRIEFDHVSQALLMDATLRVHVRDTFGITQLVWQGAVVDNLLFGDERIRVLHARLLLEPEVLDRLAANGSNSLQLTIEDHEGGIVDDAMGVLRFIAR